MKEGKGQVLGKFFASCGQFEFFGVFQTQKPTEAKKQIPIGKLFSTAVTRNIVFKRTKKAQDDVIMRAKDVLKSQQIPNINQTLERWFKNKTSPYDLLKINNVQGWLKNTSPKAYSEAYYLFATSDRVFVNNLSNLQPPVLYLTGSEDPNSTSLMSEQMAQETPNGSSESIEGEAHMMAYISAKKVNPIIEYFLNNTYNTTT